MYKNHRIAIVLEMGTSISIHQTGLTKLPNIANIYYLELLLKNRSHAFQVILSGDVGVVLGQTAGSGPSSQQLSFVLACGFQ
jgi:hypothetical protein